MCSFKLKMQQNRFDRGSTQDPAGGAHDLPRALVGWRKGVQTFLPTPLPLDAACLGFKPKCYHLQGILGVSVIAMWSQKNKYYMYSVRPVRS